MNTLAVVMMTHRHRLKGVPQSDSDLGDSTEKQPIGTSTSSYIKPCRRPAPKAIELGAIPKRPSRAGQN